MSSFVSTNRIVTLRDLRLPGKGGSEALKAIRAEFPEAGIIILTTFLKAMWKSSTHCRPEPKPYVLKSMPPKELLEVIAQVYAGRKRVPSRVAAHLAEHLSDETLTNREIEVLIELAGGNRNREVAEKHFITEETVKVHIRHIMEKLGASDRRQAVAIGLRRGVIQL